MNEVRGHGIWPLVTSKRPDSVSTHLVQKRALSMEEKRKFVRIHLDRRSAMNCYLSILICHVTCLSPGFLPRIE